MSGALIVTAEIASRDFAWLDRLRRAHYPAERYRVPAHLTILHALPPSVEAEVRRTLSRFANAPAPSASIEGLLDLDGGVAFRIVSSDLDRLRRELAEDFRGILGAKDSGGWRPHVTIQNKVSPKEARLLRAQLQSGFRPRPLAVAGLGVHRYGDGPWERIASFAFRGLSSSRRFPHS